MKEEWKNIKLTFMSYKDKNLSILTSTRDIQALVDDQQVKTATMKSSSLIGPFKEEISQWHVKLVRFVIHVIHVDDDLGFYVIDDDLGFYVFFNNISVIFG